MLSGKKIFLFSAITVMITLSGVILSYVVLSVGSRTLRLYESVKDPKDRGWEGVVHEADDMLGFRPVAGSEGYEFLPDGRTVMKVFFDEYGSRVPDGEYRSPSGPGQRDLRFMFLGCSFTFGSACRAEETFPFLVAEEAGASAVNAGVISYGFPQMLIRARQLIPETSPNVVIVQSSPWLVFRGLSMYRPTRFGRVPVPYFSVVDGNLIVAPPAYKTNIFDIPFRDFMETKRSFRDKVSFFFRVGIPLYVYTDIQDFWVRIRTLAGKLPQPAARTDMVSIERYVYSELGRICEENNALMAVLLLFFNENIVPETVHSYHPNATLINADKALIEKAAGSEKSYDVLYKHVAGDPPRIVDSHPNPRAHRMIADQIIAGLERWIIDRQRMRGGQR